jgi:hypothetical protein
VNELKDAMLPRPLFSNIIATIHPLYNLEDVIETISKIRGSSSLLATIRKCVGDNI